MPESREEKLKRLSEMVIKPKKFKKEDKIVDNEDISIIDEETQLMLNEITNMLDSKGIEYSKDEFIEKIKEMKDLNLDKIDINIGNDEYYKIRMINLSAYENNDNDFIRMTTEERLDIINNSDEMFKYSDHRKSSKINDSLRMINGENMHIINKNGYKSSQSVQNLLLMAPYNIDFMEFVSNDDEEYLYNNFPLLFLMYFSSDEAIKETIKLEEILDDFYNEGFDGEDNVLHDILYDFSYARFLKLKEDSELSDLTTWKDYTLLDNNILGFHNYVTNVLYLNLLSSPSYDKVQFFDSYFGRIFNFIIDNDLYPTFEDFPKIVGLALNDDDELYDFTSKLVYCGFIKEENYFDNMLILINMITLRYYHKYLMVNNIESDGAN